MNPQGSPDPVGAVLGPDFKKPFMLVVAIVATVSTVVLGLSKAETFVDGRIDLKLSAQRQASEDQEKRLAKMEEQFSTVKEALVDIKADVRVLRERMETASAIAVPRRP